MDDWRKRWLSWRALGAGAALALLALFLLGSPVELDARFYRFSRPGIEGLARYVVGDYAGAGRAYREDLRRAVQSREWPSADPAFAALAAGDLATAETRVREAGARTPGDVSAGLTLAEVALQRRQPAEALVILQDERGRVPDVFDALLLAAVAHARLDAPGPAIDLLNRALRSGAVEERATSFFQALEVTGELARKPAAVQPVCLLAHLHRYLRIYDSTQTWPAIRRAREAIARGDRPADAYLTLGVVYDKQGYPDDALAAFQRGLEVDPYHGEALRWAAILYNRRGDLVNEYQMIKRAYEANPEDPAYARYFGDLLLDRLGDVYQARDVWERALRERPQDARALAGLGEVETFLGDRAHAIALFEAALRLDPTIERAQWRLSRMLTLSTPGQDALALLHHAVKVAPNNPGPHAHLAMAFNGLRQYRQAISELETAFRLGWRNMADYEYLCELYFYETTNLEQAAQCFRWVLTYQPRNGRARRLLPEVERNLATRVAR